MFDATNIRNEGCDKTATRQILHLLQSFISSWQQYTKHSTKI